MRVFLLSMSFLCVSSGHGDSGPRCPRKEPPPGTVVLSPGSKLLLTCSGLVKVDDMRVNLTLKSPKTNKKRSLRLARNTDAQDGNGSRSTEAEGSSTRGGRRGLEHTDPTFTASPHALRPTSATTPVKGEADSQGEDTEADMESEEGEEGNSATKGVRLRPQWTWDKRVVEREDRDWGGLSFGGSGASLTLASVRPSDSGKYACHDGGRERFSVRVIVAEPPERPTLSCYKRSPSSKVRCDWTPQKPIGKQPQCSLLLYKRETAAPNFSKWPCSYSSQQSRCWCALDYDDDEQRTVHWVYLCVSSIAGNATSEMQFFTPLDILTPDPPSNVTVQQEEGHQTRLKVTWSPPKTWRQQDRHYVLIYEITYRPVLSSPDYIQTNAVEFWRHYTINDAIPGVEYVIRLRAKDEYDGKWSEWSQPVYARSWTVAVTVTEDHLSPEFDLTDLLEGSGSGSVADGDPQDSPPERSKWPYLAIWIAGVCAFILAAFIFRFKRRLLTKLNSLHVITRLDESSPPPPSVPVAPEGQALVTFGPPRLKERLPSDVEREEEEGEGEVVEGLTTQERMEARHFNNASYFFLQRE